MTWPSATLGELLRIKHGFAFKGEFFEDEGNELVLTPGNFKIGGGLQVRPGKERYYSGPYPDEFALKSGEVLVAMTDLTQGAPILGAPIVIPEGGQYLHNQRLGKVVDLNTSKLDLEYAYYLFVWDGVRAQLRASATGSTVRHTAPERIYRSTIPLPPKPVQRKIVSVLAAFDALISTNNLRIALLCEIARRIYHEWFVDFRFPGHEIIPLCESAWGPLPDGWRILRMDQIAEVIDCLHSKKPSENCQGEGILLQLQNISSNGIIDMSKTYQISADDYAAWISRIELGPGDCVITNVGRIAAVGQVPPGVVAAPGRNMSAVRPRAVPPTYLLQFLLSAHMAREVQEKKDAGSIMDSLNVKGIVRLSVLVPSDRLADAFEDLCRPVRRQIEGLVEARQRLELTRDFLLPRLLAGQIDVAGLDSTVAEAVA